jgi:hypothetical protein
VPLVPYFFVGVEDPAADFDVDVVPVAGTDPPPKVDVVLLLLLVVAFGERRMYS